MFTNPLIPADIRCIVGSLLPVHACNASQSNPFNLRWDYAGNYTFIYLHIYVSILKCNFYCNFRLRIIINNCSHTK